MHKLSSCAYKRSAHVFDRSCGVPFSRLQSSTKRPVSVSCVQLPLVSLVTAERTAREPDLSAAAVHEEERPDAGVRFHLFEVRSMQRRRVRGSIDRRGRPRLRQFLETALGLGTGAQLEWRRRRRSKNPVSREQINIQVIYIYRVSCAGGLVRGLGRGLDSRWKLRGKAGEA